MMPGEKACPVCLFPVSECPGHGNPEEILHSLPGHWGSFTKGGRTVRYRRYVSGSVKWLDEDVIQYTEKRDFGRQETTWVCRHNDWGGLCAKCSQKPALAAHFGIIPEQFEDSEHVHSDSCEHSLVGRGAPG